MKTIFNNASFEDYAGLKRDFIVCGVVDGILDQATLSVGVAICHPSDQHYQDEEIGQKIAEGRAMKAGKEAIYMVLDQEKIPNRFVYTILDYIIDDVTHNPGKYIKGYDQMKARHLKRSRKVKGGE